MSGRLAVGVGCRAAIAPEPVLALIGRALEGLAGRVVVIATLQDKLGEPGLVAAAARLGLPLVGLGREALAAEAPRLTRRSQAAERRFGLSGIAEAAALAAFAGRGRLVVPRLAEAGVTVAIAEETLP